MSNSHHWWLLLCTAAVLNSALWTGAARALVHRAGEVPGAVYATRRALLWLSLVYVLGCAFRSLLPMIDVPRLCLDATPVSRIFVGRSVATVAELAFAAQWALLLREAGAPRAARAVIALIACAELLSWTAVLTTNDLFHAAENSLWTVAAVLAVGFFATRWPYEGARGRQVIVVSIGCAALYVAFMLAYVLPMYFGRWQADLAAAREYLSLAEGLRETLALCRVEADWSLWRADAAWLTPYFTFAVWFSIALAHVPPLVPRAARRDAP